MFKPLRFIYFPLAIKKVCRSEEKLFSKIKNDGNDFREFEWQEIINSCVKLANWTISLLSYRWIIR
jgi:hypothetical protein